MPASRGVRSTARGSPLSPSKSLARPDSASGGSTYKSARSSRRRSGISSGSSSTSNENSQSGYHGEDSGVKKPKALGRLPDPLNLGYEDSEKESTPYNSDERSVSLGRIQAGIDNSSVRQRDYLSDLEQYDGVRSVFVESELESPRDSVREDGYDAGDDEQDESSSDHPNTRAATRAKGKGRQRPPGFRFPDPELEGHGGAEGDSEQEEVPGETPITRAELVDYLDQRDTILTHVLERIEGRLEQMDDHLQAARAQTPQDPPARERRRGGSKSNRSDPSLRRYVRAHTAAMLGIRSLRTEDIPEHPSADEIANFNETGRHGPSKAPGRWRPDLIGPKKSLWNKAAARRFRRHFLKCAQYGDWPSEQVKKALFVHMDTLRARYKTQTGQRNLDEQLQMTIKAARISRLKTLARQRKTACDWEDDLAKFSPYIQKLCDEGGMSGDESDNNHQPGRYRGQVNYFRVRPVWRAPCVSGWLDVVDKVYVALRFQENNRATPGNWIRKRHTTNRVDEKAKVVLGLPENFYDGDWLKALTRKQRRKLRTGPPLDLTHTPHVMRIATRYSEVGNRTDIPLEVDTEDDQRSESPVV